MNKARETVVTWCRKHKDSMVARIDANNKCKVLNLSHSIRDPEAFNGYRFDCVAFGDTWEDVANKLGLEV